MRKRTSAFSDGMTFVVNFHLFLPGVCHGFLSSPRLGKIGNFFKKNEGESNGLSGEANKTGGFL